MFIKKTIYINARTFFFVHKFPAEFLLGPLGQQIRRVLGIMKEALLYAESFEKHAYIRHRTDASTDSTHVLSPFLRLFFVRLKFFDPGPYFTTFCVGTSTDENGYRHVELLPISLSDRRITRDIFHSSGEVVVASDCPLATIACGEYRLIRLSI